MSFLTYLLLYTILMSSVFYSIAAFVVPSLRLTKQYKEAIAIQNALDVFVHDVRRAGVKTCKEVAPESLVIDNGQDDIGWQYQKNRFERIQGIYENGAWKKKKVSVVCLGIASIAFNYDYLNGVLVGIECSLRGMLREGPFVGYVAVRPCIAVEDKNAQ